MKEKHTKITDLSALLVFAVFALCVLTVLLYGTRVYGRMVRSAEAQFRMRTATQYVCTRVQQAESASVTDFGGCEALVLKEQTDGTVYVTYVYCYDGFLRELFCGENAALLPGDGEKLLPVEDLRLHVEADVLTVSVDGCELILQLRGKGGTRP